MSTRKISQSTKNLIAARALISDPKNWCQGADHQYGYDEDNTPYHQYCMRGAIKKVTCYKDVYGGLNYYHPFWSTFDRMNNVARQKRPLHTDVVVINDAHSTTHKDVLDLFDEVIAHCVNEDCSVK